MEKPVLIVMAAGMGSRYGGLKQLDTVDDDGNTIMDYSVFDARRAGFERVIFVIKPEMEAMFEEKIGSHLRPFIRVDYAFQVLGNLPEGFTVPEGRVKPWGTGHAVLSAKDLVHGPFVVINADDYYGIHSFQTVYDFLTGDNDPTHHAMVGFKIENTLTENGYVSRGICQLNADHCLEGVVEKVHIEAAEGGAVVTEDGQQEFIPAGTYVSMNLWGFQYSMMEAIDQNFADYLRENLPVNPLKCEYFLPLIPNRMITTGQGTVRVLPTNEKWFGVTYKEDKPGVVASFKAMHEAGRYPEHLWA